MNSIIETKEKYSVISLNEEKLTTIVAPELKAQFVMMNKKGIKNIIIDLSAVKYCDSSGLSAILVGNRLCKERKGTFVLTGIQKTVMKLISISQLESVLTIIPTTKEAIDFILMEELERDIQ